MAHQLSGTQMGLDGQNTQSSNSVTRDPNFSESEDLLLCSEWSNATNDAIIGTDQNGNAFWVKAHAYWLSHKKDNYPERAPDPLMQRFSRIKTVVNKFCGYLAQVEFLSGYTEIDKFALTKEMYLEFESKKNTGKKKSPKSLGFAFEHCWKVLRYDQKWLQVNSTKKSISLEVPVDTASPTSISLDGDDQSSTPKTVERPIGRKLAKEGRTKRKGKFVYDSSPILEKMNQSLASSEKHHNDDVSLFVETDKKMDIFLEMEKENLELKKRKICIEEKKFGMEKEMFDINMALKESAFMKIDISSLTDPDEIYFYQSMKRNIKAKYKKNP